MGGHWLRVGLRLGIGRVVVVVLLFALLTFLYLNYGLESRHKHQKDFEQEVKLRGDPNRLPEVNHEEPESVLDSEMREILEKSIHDDQKPLFEQQPQRPSSGEVVARVGLTKVQVALNQEPREQEVQSDNNLALKRDEFQAQPLVTQKQPPTTKTKLRVPQAQPQLSQEQAPLSQEQAQLSQEQAPLSQEQAPLSQEQAPLSQEQAPLSQEQAQLSQEQAPLSQEQAQLSQEQAPLSQEQAPLSQEQAQLSQEQAPLSQEQARLPQVQQQVPQVQPQVPQVQPQVQQQQAKLTRKQTHSSQVQSQLPQEQAKLPLKQTESPQVQQQSQQNQPLVPQEQAQIPKEQAPQAVFPQEHKPKIVSSSQPGAYYAVFSCSLPINNDYNYVFYLPLTALSWERIGFKNVIVLIGREKDWTMHPVLGVVVKFLLEREAIIIYLDGPHESVIMLSQVSRLFATSLHAFNDTDYLVTSDSDLWPLSKDFLLLPRGKQVISTNAFCCEDFIHHGREYEMIPMASVGASAATWRQIMSRDGEIETPRDAEGVIFYMEREFGSFVRNQVQKGENQGWFLDQQLVTLRVVQWSEIHGPNQVDYVTRMVPMNRLDRAAWHVSDLENKLDVHLLERGYESKAWLQLRPLLLYMYGGGSPDYIWCEEYRSAFLRVKGF